VETKISSRVNKEHSKSQKQISLSLCRSRHISGMTSPIIYEVNLKIENSISDEYKSWLQKHCREVISVDGFKFVEWYQRDPIDEGLPADPNHTYLTLFYHVENRQSLERYLKEFAPKFRQDGVNRFGNKFTAHRRILTFIQHVDNPVAKTESV
jgi:hypothetical protein